MTELTYLNDTYLFDTEAKVLDVITLNEGVLITLDRTIFYPQGGGQPCDVGVIVGSRGKIEVTKVRLTPEGVVTHEGKIIDGVIEVGETVRLIIDKDKRLINSRVHSAGHLVDIGIAELSFAGIKPSKGYHFPDGPYVEYEGTITNPEQYVEVLQKSLTELINKDIKIVTTSLSDEEARKRKVFAPPGKSARFVYFDGYESVGCGCGGTHLNSSRDIEQIKVRKISCKKGLVRVAYE